MTRILSGRFGFRHASRSRCFATVALVIACFGGQMLFVTNARADAQTCWETYPYHCWEGAYFVNGNFGAQATLAVPTTQFRLPNWQTDFISQELWDQTSDMGPYGQNPWGWVEAGFFTGTVYKSTSSVNERWFWADNRPNSNQPFATHVLSPQSGLDWPFNYPGQWIPDMIQMGPNQNWHVTLNVVCVGSSVNNPGPGSDVVSGLETGDQGAVGHSATGVLQWLTYGQWVQGWTSGNLHSLLFLAAPHCSNSWVYPNYVAQDGCN